MIVRRWRALPVLQRWMIAMVAAGVALASIDATFPDVASLHHAPTVALLIAAPWLLTLLLADARADAYNGQQGDMWDAQKDMALAGVGALVGALKRSVFSGR